jgi:hypothetical protein
MTGSVGHDGRTESGGPHVDVDGGGLRSLLGESLPVLVREGFLPLGAFFVGWRLSGVVVGIVASTTVSLAIFAHERRAGRDGLLVRIALASVVIEATAGLITRSTTVYLGTGVLENAIWGLAFFGSVIARHPLAGVFACVWHSDVRAIRGSSRFRRVFAVISMVWGVYLLARSALQLVILVRGTVGGFVIVAFATGKPMMFGLFAWSTWYAFRRLSEEGSSRPSALAA